MKKKSDLHNDYWQSYSDMMAALLMVFMLIIAVSFVQLQKQQAEMKVQKELFEERGEEYVRLKEELKEKQAQLDKIVGIKAEIIQSLQKEFHEKALEISLDPKTGAIRFQSEILFDTGEHALTQEGKDSLTDIAPVYIEVLLNNEYADYISEIIIEGNCDSRGTYESNLELSQQRAETVSLYCIDLMKDRLSEEEMETLLQRINVTGRSDKNVIYDENENEDLKASRRVELKFRLKDDQMIEEMLKILEDEK